jgi:hypothetical protein
MVSSISSIHFFGIITVIIGYIGRASRTLLAIITLPAKERCLAF